MTEMVVQKKSFTDPVEIEQQADQRADDVLPSETSTGPFTPETKFDKLQWRYAQTVVVSTRVCMWDWLGSVADDSGMLFVCVETAMHLSQYCHAVRLRARRHWWVEHQLRAGLGL
jgi:hypothetical protein